MFDADELIEGLALPKVKRGGQEHTGRLLSFPETLPFLKRFEELQRDSPDPEKLVALTSDLCSAIGIPPEVVLTLPAPLMLECVSELFSALVAAPRKLPPRDGSAAPATSTPTS